MQKREQDFQTRVNKWMEHKGHELGKVCIWFEAKVSRTDSLPFVAVKEKQWMTLERATQGFMYHKFSDASMMGTPCDSVYTWGDLGPVQGYIGIQFWKPREKKFYLIPIEEWMNEKETSVRKSITEQRCKEIGLTCYLA